MNQIYQTKFNVITGTTIVCSELVRRASKAMITLCVLVTSASSFALDCTASADGSYLVGQNSPSCNNINPATVNQSGNASFYILTRSRLHEQLNVGDTTLTANVNGDYTGLANQYTYGVSGGSINAGNLNFTLNNNGNMLGLATYHNVNLTAKNVELNINDNYTRGGNSSGTVASYGLLAGSSVNAGERDTYNGKYSTITVDSLKINQTAKGGKTQPILNNGIRAIQGAYDNSGDGSAGQVIINDNLDMTLTGNRSIGIYVSGNPTNHGVAENKGRNGQLTPKVILKGEKNTIIINKGNDSSRLNWDSVGIKLGKTRNTGEGPGILESHGELTIDTTNALNGSGIKMVRNSSLTANFDNSKTIIKTNGYALEIGTHDDATSSGQFEQAASHNMSISLNNAIFTTTGTSADPVIEGSVARKDLIFVDQGQQNVNFTIMGDETDLHANQDGYILNVSGNYTAPNYQFFSNTYDANGVEQGHDDYEVSSVSFYAYGKGSMTGLISKGQVKEKEGQILDINKEPGVWLDLANDFRWNLQKKGNDNISKLNTILIESGGTINAAYNDDGGNDFIVQADVYSNSGIINLDNSSHQKYNDILTIDGNYTGSNDAQIRLNTSWNNASDTYAMNSQSDVLKITGTASGWTKVIPIDANGTENVIDGNISQIDAVINTVPVIYVGQSKNELNFHGEAHTNGATEIQLAKRQTADGDEYFWTMQAGTTPPPPPPPPTPEPPTPEPPTPEPPPPEPPTPPTPPTPTPTIKPKPIFASPVAGYVAMARVNQEQGFLSIGSLHERRGEYTNFDLANCNTCEEFLSETWGRILGKHIKQDGKDRLNLESDIYGFQFGHDLLNNVSDDGSHNYTGIYLTYSKAHTDFSDKYRAVHGIIDHNKRTGKGKSESLSLGLTNTYFSVENNYLDLVGQFSYLRNKYEARNGNNPHTQNGWAFAISAEAGHTFKINQNDLDKDYWIVEPQVQLVYQYVDLDSFKDKYRRVDQNNQDLLRGRIGIRLGNNNRATVEQHTTFYAIGNILHDFIKPSQVTIGRDKLRENYARTWGELGVGLKTPLFEKTYLYGDARYEHDFGNTKRQGYRGNIGIEHKW